MSNGNQPDSLHGREALKVKQHSGSGDVRGFSLRGWETLADLGEYHPVTSKYLGRSVWFVYAAKGY